jgi:predicted O-methyltransferase YrrM
LLNNLKVNYIFNGDDKFEKALQAGQQAINQSQAEQFEIYYDSKLNEAILSWDKVSHLSDFGLLFGPGDIPGYLTDGDLLAMSTLCELMPKSGILVEVGSFLGKSSTEWAKNFLTLNKKYRIICIDSYNTRIDILHQLIKVAEFDLPPGNDQLEIFTHYTKEYPNIFPLQAFFDKEFQFNEKVDFIFEDSDHTLETLTYALPFWWGRLRDGGILSGHDYTLRPVSTAVNTFAALNELEVKTFNQSSIWYIEKN